MPLPLAKRDFDVFLSHAHKDKQFVKELDSWLTEKAGLRVWFDGRELGGGALLATDLQAAIERCRGALVVASEESIERGWVKSEYNAAMNERANDEGFRVITLKLGAANTDSLMKGLTWIDLPEARLDADAATEILRALYPGERLPQPATARDVYVSCSWRPDDGESARAVCRSLAAQGFRLIGDARDQQGFGQGDRVQRIIESCGAFVCVLPHRGVDTVAADVAEYKYFVKEIDFAVQCGLPCIIVADPRLQRSDGDDSRWRRLATDAARCPAEIESALAALWDDWQVPRRPQYVFCAMDLSSPMAVAGSQERHLIERITGMPTVVGTEIQSDALHSAIMQQICEAFVVFADISDDNVNACIEAGMGLAAGTNVKLISSGRMRNPPFMLRGAGQLASYADAAERIGVLHKLLRPFRRRVINAEL